MAMGSRLEKLVAGTSQGREHFAAGYYFASCRELGRFFSRVFQRAGTWSPSPTASGQHIIYSLYLERGCGAMASAARGPTVVNTPQFDPKDIVVPAGHQLEGWHVPVFPLKATIFHIDTDWPLLDPGLHSSAAQLSVSFARFVKHRGDGQKVEGIDQKQVPRRPPLRRVFASCSSTNCSGSHVGQSASAAEGRLGAVAGEARSDYIGRTLRAPSRSRRWRSSSA